MRVVLFALGLWFASWLCSAQNTIEAAGDFQGSVSNVDSNAFFMDRVNIWRIALTTTRGQVKKMGVRMNVNLFLSKDFKPAVGRFPVVFKYLGKQNTFGGSFIYRKGEERSMMLPSDTEEVVDMTEVGNHISGTYSFTTHKGKGDKRVSVSVKGTFSFVPPEGFPTP